MVTEPAKISNIEECHSRDDDAPLQQGDVIEWVTPAPPWRSFGVIITGDCDILHKPYDFVSYVPIIPLGDLVRYFWLPRESPAHLKKIRQTLAARINKRRASSDPDALPLSDDAICDWLDRVGGAALLDELEISDKGQRSDLLKITDAYSSLKQMTDYPSDLADACQRMLNCGLADGDKLRNKLKNFLIQLQDDQFYIGTLRSDRREGYVALLAFLSRIETKSIALNMPQLEAGAKTKRIARMRERFLFSLTRRLSAVFADIALPEQYQDNRQGTVAALCEAMIPSTRAQ